jgi:hypothetical protein
MNRPLSKCGMTWAAMGNKKPPGVKPGGLNQVERAR